MIHPYQFREQYIDSSWQFSSGFLHNPHQTEYSYMGAPLNLPHGATITKLTLYYYDNSTKNLSIMLKAQADNFQATMASIYTSGQSSSYQNISDTTIYFDFATVDNQSYSYFLDLAFEPGGSTNLMLTNVRIDYEYSSNLPLINK